MDGTNSTPRARTKHVCNCCTGIIWPGETYRREVSFCDGRVGVWKTCPDCEKITDRVWRWAIYPDEGITYEDFEDWARSYSTEPEARAYLHRLEHSRPNPKGTP